MASFPEGAAGLLVNVHYADALLPLPMAQQRVTAATVLELARHAQQSDASAPPPTVMTTLAELDARCDGAGDSSLLCLGPDVGRAQLQIILALAGHSDVAPPARAPLPWHRGHDDNDDSPVPSPRAYHVPTPPGFLEVPWDPRIDGTEARRFAGARDSEMAGVIVTVRAPEGLLASADMVPVSCPAIDAAIPTSADRSGLITELRGPLCARVGRSSAAWVEESDRPLVWSVVTPQPEKLARARMRAEVASMNAWPMFDGVERALVQADPTAVANLNALASGEEAQMPSGEGWQASRAWYGTSYSRPRWVASFRPSWEAPDFEFVFRRPSGALEFEGELSTRWETPAPPDTPVPHGYWARNDIEAALAEIAASCPEIASLALPDANECREYLEHTDNPCEIEAGGSVRTLTYGVPADNVNGESTWMECAIDLATCAARVVRTMAASKRYSLWATDAAAPHPERFLTWGGVSLPRGARTTFEGAPTLIGRPRDFEPARSCRAQIEFDAMRVVAGPWLTGRPAAVPVRLVREGQTGPVPPSLRGAVRENGTFHDALEFHPKLRHASLVFYIARSRRLVGQVLAVYDESTDRHRMLFDADTSALRGNILIHNLIGTELLISVLSPSIESVSRTTYLLIDIASGSGRALDLTSVEPRTVDFEAEEEEADHEEPTSLGAPLIEDVDGTPTLLTRERVGSRMCERRAPLAELVRTRER